ncbi:type 1 secretion target domain-containng protein [Enterobacter hormaechei]|uniref:Ig-like domain-containing protein n=1 Tax=Enterobacter hormaechei TaxID=158836 RepID=UPI000795ABF8|nr:Ig-like domain-containing protein [Enterobacter hormaechei]CZU67113.1 type 1 secretion target domain-containng protein [Enterobacter hormaechei]
MSNAKVVDVIIRKTAEKTKLTGEGNLSVSISSPSVIEIQGSAQDVVRYVRQGNDLLIYMKDGSVIRCNNYFVEDTETHNHSELVFNDNQELTHISFADAGEASGVAATELTAQAAPISSIEPFLEQGSVLSDAPWGWIAGAALGGGAIGALLAHGGDGETKTKVIDNTKEVESATPTFLLTDNAGDKQGVLSAKEVTDDNTPTFSGTGQPGATIQVKDSSGSTIASTMVAKDGTWTVTLPTQADGEHTWSVVQIDGSKTTSAGSITVTVSTADTSVTLATTAGDNVINASEQAAGFTLSGTSKNLAQGTALTVTLNGKTYSAEVGANGAWSVKVPAADAQALGDGTWTVNVSGKDAAGNTVTGSQTIGVDTAAPAISVDTIAQDNIINAAEHNQPLTLTGKTDAEAGQIVTVTLNGKNHTATVGSDGTWSVTLSASEVQAMANGEHTLTANVSDKAGNGASTTADFTVDTAAPVVTINTVAGDDILNTSEQGQAQIISGQANGAAAGDVVTVTVGGKTFTGVVQADGSWSVGVPASVIGALGEGSHSISVSVTDAAGNTGSATHGITLSGNPPEFTLDPISQDNVLNAQEAMQPLSLSGTSNLPNGSAVTVTLNNVNYQATVENGSWSVQVPVSDVLDLANTLYTVSVSGTDSVGNSGSAEANLLVDTALPQVILNSFAGDNLVNNAEAAVDQTLSGRVTGAAAGDTVSVTVGGKSYTATVGSDLKWSVTIPSADLQAFGDGDLTFSASVTNAHGNTGTGERDININAELPGLRVNTISGDDVINAIEQQQDLAVTGSSTHLAEGTQITVTINNVEYVTTVNASGSWQIGVPSADLQAWTAGGMTVSVSAEDAWGNTVAAEHPIELDLNAVAVTIDTVTTDDRLNAAEKGADVTLSGQTQGVEAGQTVVVKFADQTFTAQVQQDGSWRLTVPASAMETLIDGRAQVSVSVTNVNGNSADASRVVIVDTQPPAITLDNLTDDNIINAAEAQQDLVLSGSTTAEAGQTVTVTLNGKSYQTTVQADGRWQLNVPAADVGALTDGNVTVTATVSDVAGNSSSADRVGLVDATVPQVTINDFVTDTNTVNQLAHSQAQILSGSVTGAAAGDLVIITINNVDYTTVVDAAGNWSLGLPASVVQGLTDGTWTINVSVTDRSGNTGSSSVDVVVNTVTPVIGINTLAADDVINAAEKGEDLLLSGTSNQPEGTTITVNLNGINYAATTDASGNWSVTVPASAVSALGEANYTVTASVTDNVGNSASATHDVLVDSSLPVVTLNNVAGDNIVNAAEVAAGQTLTGKVSNAASGDTVTIIIGGQTYTATVQDDLTWSLPLTQSQLTALGNGDLTVSASVTNAHGNTGSSSLDVTIDAQLPGLRIDTVAGDDVINVIEHAQNLVISGTSTDLAAGSTVTVSINGKSYSASVLADGTWQAAVPAADVSRWEDGSLTISASAQDTSGNPVNIGTVVDVDLAPVAISINSVTDDNVLNAAEKGQDLVLSGSSSNVEAGQTVTIIFAGKTWTTMVDANGDWTCTVPAAELSGLKDGDASVQVSVTNMNGNAASSSQAFSVDTAAPAVTINTISGDNMLNAAEAAQDLTLSGTSTSEAGQTVTVTFNGNQYTAQVQANGSWTLDVPAADLAGIADGSAAVTATVSDKAGNPASAGVSVLVDTTVPQITFNIVAGDDIVNIAEHGQALIVTGKVTGAQAGDVITLTLNGKDYTAMLDGAGNWSVGVPAADVGALANGDQTISATLTDKAGNSTSATHAFDVSLTAPVIAITTLAVDDVINATEKGQDLLVSGTSNQPDGTRITVTLNGISYAATTDASGNWSVTVPAANVSALGEASYSVTASVTDTAGNSANTSHSVLVDSALPQVTINAVATDDVINAAEVASGQTLSGKVSGAASGDTVTIGIGGNTYTATVQDDLSWSVNVASDVLTAIGNGDLTVTASVTNGHGNTGTGERDITIDASLPGLRVDTVAGDDVINSIEHTQNLIITGSSDGLASGSALTVTVNGKTYAATVLADGTWTAAIPAADVGALSAGTVTVTVDGQSAAGNPVSISHDVKVDLAPVAISIDAIATDDVINAAEKGADLVLSGSTTNVEENQTVTIIFGGKTYSATVDASGHWTATVPSADLGGLKDGDTSVQVSVTNVNGNSASAGREYSVDATAPTVSIEIVSDNNIINAAEAQQDLVINGVSDAEAGQTVTVTLNGENYITTVQANGSWSVTVPSADVGAISDGDYTITAAVQDKAGNPASADRDVLVDTTVPQLTINTVSDDDVINSAEHAQALIVTGSVTGAAAGDVVTVTINNKDYTATLDASGKWNVGVPAADVSALTAGDHTITAALTDKAGNSNSTTHEVEVNLTAPVLTIDTVSGDDVINNTEKTQDLTITGTASGLATGAVVTVILNGKAYSATVATNGQWTTTVPANEVGQLGEALYTVSASATDSVGNSTSTSHTVNVESVLPGVIINTVAGDDVINAAELATGQTISGKVVNAEAGNTVTVTIGGNSYTATVQSDLTWSVSVPESVLTALGNGDLTVSASVTNGVGNSGTGEREIVIDANLPGLRVDTVAGDDVVNSIEHGQNLIITGSSDGLTAGTALTVTVNGKTYAATVLADGTWSAAIPSADVSALAAGTVTVNVEGQSSAGNPVTINHDVTVDLANVAISINALATDDVINAAEKGADLVLSGTTSNVEENQNVTITFGGKNYTATVDAEGKWTATVPSADLTGLKDGDASVQVSVTNVNGNSASAGREYSVDATAPSVTINTIATDDILNASEAQSDLAISGTSTAEAGQTLTVSLNGKDYTTTVSANGSWTLNVPAADLAGLTDGSVTVTASVSDKAGNPASVDHTLTVDETVPGVTIHTVAGDDVINAAEHNQAQIVSGSATGAAAGDKVTVTIGGQTYTTVLDAAGNWSVGVPASVISGLSDGTVTVTASVTDAAGNTGSGTHNVTVDTGLPSVSFNAISDDNVLNSVEKGQDLGVSGTSANLAEGTVVTVILNGKNYTATTAADGTWSLTVPAADLASLGEANYTLSATATNAVGNSVSNTANLLVDTALPTVTINTVAGDNVINAAEVAAGQTLSGRVTNAEAGNTVTVTIGGNSYTATVQSDLTWSVNVPESVLTALGNGDLTVSATVTNDHGNSGTGERDITIDASLPGLRVDTVAGDDVINSIEHGQNLIVTGSSDGLAAGTTLTVTLNGKTYAASVLADGSWTAAIPAADVGALAAGTMTVTVAGQSAAGNPVSISHDVTVDLAAVAISIDAIATDDVINAAEKGADLVLSGSTSNVEENQTVTITFGGKSYTAKVDADGNWTANVPSSDLAGLKDGDASVQVSITNAHGNSASAGREYSVDATAPTVTIDTVAGDNVINGSEAAAGVAISGTTTAEVGQTVTVTFGGNSYTAQVQQGGVWSVNVPGTDLSALADNGYTVQVSVSDAAGNPGSAGKAITLDTTPPTVSFNVVAGDDVINSVEHGQAQVVSGTATGASVGDKLIITIGSNQYTTTVDASGKWSVGVPASDISALTDGTVTLSATITDSAGNSSTQTHDVVVNTASVALTVNTLSGDDVINAAEAGASLVINGSSAQFASGTQVTITLNGKSYTATIQSDGAWQTTVPAADVGALADGASYQVSASAQDSAGNSASATHTISVDTTAPVISVNTLSGDDVLNAAEAQQPLTVHGSSSAEAGQTVTVTLGGKTYTALVGSDGTWTLDVPAADLVALSQGALTVTAVVNDKAGNSGQTTHTLTVDTVAPAVTISTVADDDIVNNAEQLAGQTISGTTTAEQGQTVTVSFNGHSYQATVGADGSWSVFVPGRDFLGLSDGDYTITATVSDKAGNPGSATHDVTLNGDVPTIVINTFAQDDIVNAAEHGTPLIVSGTTDAPAGQTVTITLNGKTYTATVQNDGTWSYTVGSADVTALADGGSYVINAQVSNAIGNSASDNHSVTVDLTAPSMGISIDSLQNDTGLSASDFITNDKQVVVNGSLTAQLGNNEKAQISLDGGVTWIDLTVTGTTWRYTDGRTLTDGTYPYQVRVIDNAGNVGATDSQDVVIDLTKPAATSITVDSVSQDTGLSDSDFITSDNQISLKGTLGAALGSGDHAQISLDGGATWTDVSVSGLSWTYVDGRTLADGDYNYQLRVIDDAGNISATTSQVVTIDTVSPDASKTIAIDSISDDTGLSSSDFITNDTSLTLHGSLGATLADGEYAQISIDGGVSWQNVIVTGNSWYFVDGRTLGNGTYDYYVRVIDIAGNIGGSAYQKVTVDLVAPDSAITLSIDSISTDTGYSDSDFLTNDTSLTINGSIGAPLSSGEYVQISVDNGLTWQYVTMNGNRWSFIDIRDLPEGEHTYQVRVVDLAGNTGATAEQVVTVDLTPSNTAATIISYTDEVGSSRGEFSAGTTTDDRLPVLNGTLSSSLLTGELVRVYRADGTLLGEADVNGTSWSFALTDPLVDGEKGEFYAVVVDAAGNETTPSPVFDFTVDLQMYVEVQDTLDTTPIITGRVDFEILDGEYVEVTVNNVVYSSRNGVVVVDPKNSTWYVQIPDADALALGTYDVKAALYKADGTQITADDSANELTVSPTPEISFTSTAASSQDTGTALTLAEDGSWRILSNSTVFTQNATSSTTLGSFSSVAISGPDRQQQSTFVDFDRDGLMDILGADTSYANGQQSFKYNADGTYTTFQVGSNGVAGQTNDVNGNTWSWYGGVMGIDIDGDGFVDMVYGDGSPNDSNAPGGYDTQIVMNTDGTIIGFDKSGAYVETATTQDGVASTNNNNAQMSRDLSGVDLNNDGYVDIVYHGTVGTNYTSGGGSSSANTRLVVATNGVDANGNYTLTNTQIVTGVFYGNQGTTSNYYTTMTWADLNGDGYMDLFVGGLTGQGNATSAVFYNDGAGNLTAAANGVGTGSNVQTFGDSVNSMTSLAVDWNGDGKMDLIEIAGAAGSTVATNANNIGMLWLNNGVNAGTGQVNWSSQTLLTGANQGSTNVTTGALALDLDYDGDRDLVVFRAAGGKTEYIENTSTINDGTSIILRISDANGINAFYGNTVLLVDESTGKVVSSQVINPQGGVNMNDSTGLVYFYGLDASKSYSAVLLSNANDFGGVSSVSFDSSGTTNTIENVNASWAGLKAVEKNHAYVLTAENGDAVVDSAQAATDGSNSVGIVGTGYNDTLYATAGTHIYNGGGGSRVVSDVNVWTAEGGMDIVDYKLAGSTALNIDLSKTGMQDTGFGSARFVNIEGLAGGNGDDVFTGNTADNFFEGRGGNDTFNIGSGGQDTLLYKLINASDATGGNGSDVVNGFTVGTWEGTADTDRIDLRDLLSDSGYTGTGSASYVNGVATLDSSAGNIADYIRVVQNGSNTEIQVDLDGTGGQFSPTTLVTLNGVQTDLATLLANHQLLIA